MEERGRGSARSPKCHVHQNAFREAAALPSKRPIKGKPTNALTHHFDRRLIYPGAYKALSCSLIATPTRSSVKMCR